MLDRLRRRPAGVGGAVLPARAAATLHAMPASVGRDRKDNASYDWHGLRRGPVEFLLVQHTFAGRGRLSFERREFDVEPGQTMLLRIPHDHRYRAIAGQPWDFAYLILHGSETMRLARQVLPILGPVACLPTAVLHVFASTCLQLLDEPTMPAGRASALGYAVLTSLLDIAGPIAADVPPTRAQPPWVADVRRHVHRHLDTDLSVTELADVAGMSRAHFSRAFVAHVGRPPAAFVQETRMREAARLLQSTSMSVKLVAARCGYADPAYFTKCFRRYINLTPTTFRNSGMYSPEK